MATVRLIPSTYSTNDTSGSYLAVSNVNNMYANTDSTNYATITNNSGSTGSYYIYLKGFNFSEVPDNAIINSFTVKLKAYMKSVSTSTSYRPYLVNNTTTITGSCNTITTTTQTLTFTGVTATWDTIKGYGSNFGIRINTRRANKNTTSYVYIYGAEILVDYTESIPRTITTSASGCTINPDGTTVVNEGDSFRLDISAPNQNVTITDNGVNVTSQLQEGVATGEVSSTPTSYTTNGSITGSYYQQAVGKDHNASNTTNNNYCSSSGSTAYVEYSFDVSAVPDNAQITSVVCKAKGHCESTTASTEVSRIQLYSGSTAKGSSKDFTSTSDSVIEIGSDATWTKAELNNAKLRYTIGYYGGNISGASLIVTYAIESDGYIYYYIIDSVSSDHTIVVVCDSETEQMYVKVNGSWQTVSVVYKKVNDVWVEQTDLTNLFDISKNYVKG